MKKKVLITAGPTREMLDPVRFLSNLSTGEMGYALAHAARGRRYEVTLVSGPTALKPPRGVRFHSIMSARQMKQVCQKEFPRHDVLIMTAAVCDFTAQKPHRHKIHRTRTRQLHLKRTSDIIAGLARKKGKRLVIGFCLETQDWIRSAEKKLKKKNLDGIVANTYSKGHIPFGNRRVTTALIDRKGRVQQLKGLSKRDLSGRILRWTESLEKTRLKD